MQRNNNVRENKRTDKVCKMLQKALAEILVSHSMLFDRVFITVTMVNVSTDFSTAKVYLSVISTPDHNRKEIILQKIIKQKNVIKRMLSIRIGRKMRRMPTLQFYIDNSVDNAMHLQRLFESLNVCNQ